MKPSRSVLLSGHMSQRTLVALIGVLLLALTWGTVFLLIERDYRAEIESVNRENRNLAKSFEEHVNRTLSGADNQLDLIAAEYEREKTITPAIRALLDAAPLDQAIIQTAVIDRGGNYIASRLGRALKLKNVAFREYFQNHRESDSRGLVISAPMQGHSTDKALIVLSRRLNQPDGTFGGIVFSAIAVDYFSKFYRQMEVGQGSVITLGRMDGVVLVRVDGDQVISGLDVSRGPLFQHVQQRPHDSVLLPSAADGISRFMSYRVLFDYPVFVVVSTQQDKALADYAQRRFIFIAVAVLLSFLIIAAGWALNRQRRRENRVQEALERKTDELEHMAYHDVLTGLPNRAQLNLRLEAEMEKAQRGESRGAVLFIDVDNLKTVNDTYGHKCGDAIIVLAAGRVASGVGEAAFVARIGGDEFVAVLPEVGDKAAVAKVADAVIAELSKEYEALGFRFYMSASVGVVLYPQDGFSSEEILKNADNAMYTAKKEGKNCWRFFELAMQTEAFETIKLTNSLRYALERREFDLLYQPQVVADSNRIVGFEALLRWKSLECGAVSPDRFIPLAEQSGLIHLIGQWVLGEACRFVNRLAQLGQGTICIAVNVSPYQLTAENFADVVHDILQENGVRPDQIDIEITETALMLSLEKAIHTLDEIDQQGVRLSLDDFGTGYSSLTYLSRLPVKTLKIDKSFIDRIAGGEEHSAIIQTIIDMAHNMNMTVVAEGVETNEQREYLVERGCDFLQGYIFSKPVTEDEAIRLLEQDRGLEA